MGELRSIYIISPYSSDRPDIVKLNIEVADRIAHNIRKLGAFAVVAHSMSRCIAHGELPDPLTPEQWYEGTLRMMRGCDAAFAGYGWRDSIGCRNEYREASLLGIPVFHSYSEVKAWLNGGEPT